MATHGAGGHHNRGGQEDTSAEAHGRKSDEAKEDRPREGTKVWVTAKKPRSKRGTNIF